MKIKKKKPQKNQQQQKGKKLPSRERLSKIMVLNLNKVQENTEYNCPWSKFKKEKTPQK